MAASGFLHRRRSSAMHEHLLRTLAAERAGPLHFPACYLGFEIERLDREGSRVSIDHGPHTTDSRGAIAIAAVALLADISLSVAMRQHIHPDARMATLELHLRFNGAPIDGRLTCHGAFDAPSSDLATHQGNSSGRLFVGDRLVGLANGTFINPPLPPGVSPLVPLVVGRPDYAAVAPLDPAELDDREQAALRRVSQALRLQRERGAGGPTPGFVEAYWGLLPRRSKTDRVSTRLVNGPHIGNRVGHVQGGILFGAAASNATVAAPAGTRLTSASAWYLRPGLGERLDVASTILQSGRNVTVVRTEIRSQDGSRVLEMVSGHALPA